MHVGLNVTPPSEGINVLEGYPRRHVSPGVDNPCDGLSDSMGGGCSPRIGPGLRDRGGWIDTPVPRCCVAWGTTGLGEGSGRAMFGGFGVT